MVLSLHEESNKSEACVEIPCEAKDSLRWAIQPVLALPVWLGSRLDLGCLEVGGNTPPAFQEADETMIDMARVVSPELLWLVVSLSDSDNKKSGTMGDWHNPLLESRFV